MTTSIGFLAGALVSAVVVVAVSLQAAFAIAGLAFLPVAAIASRLPDGGCAPGGAGGGAALPGAPAALRLVAAQPWMRLRVGLFGAAALVESTLDLLLVVVALELLHLADGGVGWLRAAFAAGCSSTRWDCSPNDSSPPTPPR